MIIKLTDKLMKTELELIKIKISERYLATFYAI